MSIVFETIMPPGEEMNRCKNINNHFRKHLNDVEKLSFCMTHLHEVRKCEKRLKRNS